jgi:DNA-binding protein HU-beta
MTKADLVKNISDKTGMDKSDVQMIAEKFMNEVKNSLKNNENVYIRGFGSFIVKTRAKKTGRNISKNIAVVIPAHNIPAFKPSNTFVNSVKQNVPIV